MQLKCKSCGQLIPAEDVNLDLAIAKCRGCDAVFSFLDDVAPVSSDSHPGPLSRGEGGAAEPAMLPVPMPKRFQVEELGKDLTITYRWFTPVILFMVFFCVFWDGFLIFWYAIALGIGFGIKGGPPQAFSVLMLLFPLLHLAVGVGLTYYTIAAFVNRTIIRAAGGELSVTHGPFPWFGNHRLPIADVRQVYVTKHERTNKGHRTYSYTVNVLKTDATKLTFIWAFSDRDEALWVQRKLREHLGLGYEHVEGALRA